MSVLTDSFFLPVILSSAHVVRHLSYPLHWNCSSWLPFLSTANPVVMHGDFCIHIGDPLGFLVLWPLHLEWWDLSPHLRHPLYWPLIMSIAVPFPKYLFQALPISNHFPYFQFTYSSLYPFNSSASKGPLIHWCYPLFQGTSNPLMLSTVHYISLTTLCLFVSPFSLYSPWSTNGITSLQVLASLPLPLSFLLI